MFILFSTNLIRHLMQIVSNYQILFSGENKKNITNFSSAEFAPRVV